MRVHFASGPQIPKLRNVQALQNSRHVGQGCVAPRADRIVETGPQNLKAAGNEVFRGGGSREEREPTESVIGR